MALAECRLKSTQHDRAQLALAHVHGRGVGAAFGRAVSGEMFGFGDNGVVGVEAFALRSAHVRQAKLSGEIGIFAKVFFDAPPARIAGQVQDGRKNHVDAGGARLCRDRRAGLLRDCRVPRGGEIDGRRKDRSGIEAVQCPPR